MAKALERDIERLITKAFGDLTNWARCSEGIGEIAMQPNKVHEQTIRDQFRMFLDKRKWNGVSVLREEGKSPRYDIVLKRDSVPVAMVEVKTPFTNHDGIRNKTREYSDKGKCQLGPLHKDLHSLRTALDCGTLVAYSLVTPIGCYPVDSDGEMVVLNPRSIIKNEKAIKVSYPIKWPTRPDYETSVKHGTPEVDRVMKDFASEHGLIVKHIKGWDRVALPSPRPDVYTFLDCALYRVQLD